MNMCERDMKLREREQAVQLAALELINKERVVDDKLAQLQNFNAVDEHIVQHATGVDGNQDQVSAQEQLNVSSELPFLPGTAAPDPM